MAAVRRSTIARLFGPGISVAICTDGVGVGLLGDTANSPTAGRRQVAADHLLVA